MASYKVIQDIESEDHLIWRLTLRQLIYAMIAGGLIFVGYLLYGILGLIAWVIALVPALPFILLAIPLNQDQPNDIWLLARLNFLFKPKKRLWCQIGDSHTFLTISCDDSPQAPASPSHNSKNVAQQIHDLSAILDSRGYSIVNQQQADLNWEAEHEAKHTNLNQAFQNLLSKQYQNKQETVNQRFKNLSTIDPAVAEAPLNPVHLQDGQTILVDKPSKFDTMMSMEKMQNVKISALEERMARSK